VGRGEEDNARGGGREQPGDVSDSRAGDRGGARSRCGGPRRRNQPAACRRGHRTVAPAEGSAV